MSGLLRKNKKLYKDIYYDIIDSYPKNKPIHSEILLERFNSNLPPSLRLAKKQFVRVFFYSRKYLVFKRTVRNGISYIFFLNEDWEGDKDDGY